jgi:cephalosporin hydroxylase
MLTRVAHSDASEGAKSTVKSKELTPEERELVEKFQWLFAAKTGGVFNNHWFGIRTLQHPFDLWVTQEILSEVKPDLVVEAGTYRGGSAIIWAMILEHLNPEASVITIDIKDIRADRAKQMPIAKRKVKFLLGGSTDPEMVADVKRRAAGKRVLIILDSLHTKDHVLEELRAYWDLVPVGSYIIVQDSAINGQRAGPGPWEAVEAFMAENDHFEIDKSRERFLLTDNPNGFLKRVR